MTTRHSLRRLGLIAVVALVAGYGSEAWQRPTSAAAAAGTSSGAATATATAGGIIPEGLWVTTTAGDLVHLDPDSGAVVRTIPLELGEGAFTSLAYSAGYVWVSVAPSAEVLRVDPGSGEIVRLPVSDQACCIVADEDQVWVGGTEREVAVRLDPHTGSVVATSEVGGTYPWVFLGRDSVVAVLDYKRKELLRLGEGGAPHDRRTVEGVVHYAAVLGDEIWLRGDDALLAYSMESLERTHFVDVTPLAVAAGDQALWVAAFARGLIRVDPETGSITEWAPLEGASRIVAGSGRLFVVDADGSIQHGSTSEPGLTRFTELPAPAYALVLAPTHAADGSLVQQPALPSPTPTPAPVVAVDVPAGVRWEPVDLPSDAAISTADSVWVTERGVVVVGRESQRDGGRPVIWTSADGAAFSRSDTRALSPPGSHVYLRDVAVGAAGFAAVGQSDAACTASPELIADFDSCCARRRALAWFSGDGVTWVAARDTDGSFRNAQETQMVSVIPYGSGFLAAGVARRSKTDYRLPIWASEDGRNWRRVALLRERPGLLSMPSLASVGDRVLLGARLFLCGTPSKHITGFGFGLPPLEVGRAFASKDGVRWKPIDLVAAGLAVDRGPVACRPTKGWEGRGGVSAGTLSKLGAGAQWREAPVSDKDPGALWTSSDGTAWTQLPSMPVDAVIDRLLPVTGGAVDDLLLLEAGDSRRGRTALAAYTFDGEQWTDWSAWDSGIPTPLPGPSGLELWRVDSAAARLGDLAVLVGSAGDANRTSVHAVAYVSRPASVMPEEEPTCEPAHGARCTGVTLLGTELADADLREVDLTGALLRKVDLRGADLSGAKLDDTEIDGVKLAGATLAGASLRRAVFISTPLDGVDLSDADLRDTRGMDSAVGAVFAGSTLVGGAAVLADYSRADFRGADLTDFMFLSTDLTKARLKGAVLKGVDWSGSTCPDGTRLALGAQASCAGHFIDR
jgi:uncharacterized protein YjbI with pentapeptide repeats/streptogramin lyase